MPETLRSPNLSHKPVPYTAICHMEEEEDDRESDCEGSWSDTDTERENVEKNLINMKEEGSVAVKGRGLERKADCEDKHDLDKLKTQTSVFPKNGLRLHQRRTMEVKEVGKGQREAAETVL